MTVFDMSERETTCVVFPRLAYAHRCRIACRRFVVLAVVLGSWFPDLRPRCWHKSGRLSIIDQRKNNANFGSQARGMKTNLRHESHGRPLRASGAAVVGASRNRPGGSHHLREMLGASQALSRKFGNDRALQFLLSLDEAESNSEVVLSPRRDGPTTALQRQLAIERERAVAHSTRSMPIPPSAVLHSPHSQNTEGKNDSTVRAVWASVLCGGACDAARLNLIDSAARVISNSLVAQLLPYRTMSLALNNLRLLEASSFQCLARVASRCRTLTLAGCQLTELPTAFERLHKLNELNVAENALEQLPSWVVRLSALRELHATSNALTALPAALGRIQYEMRILNVAHNQLITLPGDLANMRKLDQLIVNNNRLLSLGFFPAHDGDEDRAQVGGIAEMC